MDSNKLLNTLAQQGWVDLSSQNTDRQSILIATRGIADLLGKRVGGRNKALEEVIKPLAQSDAHPQSLSARYGLNAFPLHIELSHRYRPCRYLLFGCIEPGTPSVKTLMLDWRSIEFSQDELSLFESAPIFVRSGRRSFYGTILSPNRTFLRYDPGCIEAVDQRGNMALRLIEKRLVTEIPTHHCWARGDILVIDNWRVLHGRESANQTTARHLIRILVHG